MSESMKDVWRKACREAEAETAKLRSKMERLKDAYAMSQNNLIGANLQNGELRDALQSMTGLFGEAVTRHQMGKGFSELHAEAVKSAKAALAKYTPKPPQPRTDEQRKAIENVADTMMTVLEKRLCGLSKPLGIGETCTLEADHRGPCDHTQKQKCEHQPYHPMYFQGLPICSKCQQVINGK